MTPLAKAADVVLPGSSWLEKDATYVNGSGRLQAASRAINPPGEARDDWQVFVSVGRELGTTLDYASSSAVRSDIAAAIGTQPRYAGLSTMTFSKPVSARHWLQASNPSERWKWDFMFQDLPPVKFSGTPRASGAPFIPIQKVD
jgi:predicted molibdopterin-dependent oxidoreductase YjgC